MGDERKIGFIGTGIMGSPMACRLAAAGFEVTAWNRTPSKLARLPREILHAPSVSAAVRDSDAVICMLTGAAACDAVLLEDRGAIAAMRPGSLLVVMSSIPPDIARAHAVAASRRDVDYIDAPVSGGEKGAQAGTLAIMAGGPTVAIARAAAFLQSLGRVTHVGPVGAGSLTKLANQVIVAATVTAVAEALLLAERGGADMARVREALLGGFADSTILRQHGKRMVERRFVPGGTVGNQIKDTSTALDCAATLGLRLPILQTVDSLFGALAEHGGAALDHSAILLELRRSNGEAQAVQAAVEGLQAAL
jgi:3-hydroxyisobutyrate dehydrogenase-like beta-hydroxyacid dehydrogenase